MQERREMQVRSLGQEDPLEEGMASHSVLEPGESLQTGEPGELPSVEAQRARHNCSNSACTQAHLELNLETLSCETKSFSYC